MCTRLIQIMLVWAHPSPQPNSQTASRSVHHFGRPFVKRFALSYWTVVCLSCPVCLTLVYCGQTAGWIKTKLGMEVGLGPGHIVLDGSQLPLHHRGTVPQLSAHVYCGQTVAHLSYCCALVLIFCRVESLNNAVAGCRCEE